MKSPLIVLAIILPLAMTAATSGEPDIDFPDRLDLDLDNKQELTEGKRCQLNTKRATWNVPCAGLKPSGRKNKGQAVKLVCKVDIDGT